MKVKQYLEMCKASDEVTFIKARARKDAATPFYHAEYQGTSMMCAEEWLGRNVPSKLLESVILNDRQPPIQWLSGAPWDKQFEQGRLKCLLVISEEDFALLYPSEEQRTGTERYCESKMQRLSE